MAFGSGQAPKLGQQARRCLADCSAAGGDMGLIRAPGCRVTSSRATSITPPVGDMGLAPSAAARQASRSTRTRERGRPFKPLLGRTHPPPDNIPTGQHYPNGTGLAAWNWPGTGLPARLAWNNWPVTAGQTARTGLELGWHYWPGTSGLACMNCMNWPVTVRCCVRCCVAGVRCTSSAGGLGE